MSARILAQGRVTRLRRGHGAVLRLGLVLAILCGFALLISQPTPVALAERAVAIPPTLGLDATATADAPLSRPPPRQPRARKRRPTYHAFASTPPFDLATSARLVNSDDAPVFSESHCFADNLQVDAWRTRSCYMQNVCFNFKTKHVSYYAREGDPGPRNVSKGVFNQKWSSQYDQTVNFGPVMRTGPLPTPRFDALADEFYMAILPFAPSNIGHLIWDDFLASYLATLHVLPHPSRVPWKLRPIWFNAPYDPPWATCDWTRIHEGPGHSLGAGFSLRCDSNIKRWLPLFIGPGNEALIETHKWFDNVTLPAYDVCFPNIVFGPSAMSNQGAGLHGWNPTDLLPPAAGRGPLIWDFRGMMMRHAGAEDLAPGSLDEIKVFFAEKASNRVYVNYDRHRKQLASMVPELEEAVAGIVGRKVRIVEQSLNLAKYSAKEQVEAVRSAAVYVTVAGGGSFSAQFLPRGAGMILYHASKGDDVHKGLVDYKFWLMIGWVRATFVDTKDSQDMALFARLVREEILLAASFLDAVAKDPSHGL